MGFSARFIFLLLLANTSEVVSVTILGSGKNTLVAVLIGRITNETLGDLKTHISSLQKESKPLNDFSNVQQDNPNGFLDIAVKKLTNQYTSIANQMQSLQMTIDIQSKMHQEAMAVQSKLLAVLETQSKMIEMVDKRSKKLEEAVSRSNSHVSKTHRLIEEQSQKQQNTINSQSNMLDILRKIDAQATNQQKSIDMQKNNIEAQRSKIAQIISNQSEIRNSQYKTNQLLDSLETQSKSQLTLHQAVSAIQAQMLDNLDVKSQNHQKSSDTQAKIILMMDSVSETLRYIDTQLGEHQADIRSQISKMIEQQSDKFQTLTDQQSEIQQALENINGHSEDSETTLKLLELMDKHSKKVQRSIDALSTDNEDKVNRIENYISQIFQMLQNIIYQMRGQQTVPVPPWKMPGVSGPQMPGHTFETRSENRHMSIGVRPDGPNPDWMFG